MYSGRIVAQCVVQRVYHACRTVGTGTLTVRYMVRYMVRYGTSVLRYVSVTVLYCSVQYGTEQRVYRNLKSTASNNKVSSVNSLLVYCG